MRLFLPSATLLRPLFSSVASSPAPAILFLAPLSLGEIASSHAQRLANGTGASVVLPPSTLLSDHEDQPSLAAVVDDLRAHNPQRHVGVFGLGEAAVSSLNLAASFLPTEKGKKSNPLNAVATFYSFDAPRSTALGRLPQFTPVQCHFAEKSPSASTTAAALTEMWSKTIAADGGLHSHGFHRDEFQFHTYPANDGFLVAIETLKAAEADRDAANLAWKRVFDFFRKHLKELK